MLDVQVNFLLGRQRMDKGFSSDSFRERENDFPLIKNDE
jgi:hypothetical protein